MNDSSELSEFIALAQGLGFEVVSCEGRVRGLLLCDEDVYFGGTLQECSAFLTGWKTLRHRVLGSLRTSPDRSAERVVGPVAPSPCQLAGLQVGPSQPYLTTLDPIRTGPARSFPNRFAELRINSEVTGRDALSAYPSTLGHAWTGQTSPRRLFEPPLDPASSRDRRQTMIAAWAELSFGRDEATDLPHRGLRLLEEAIEAFQACGGNAKIAKDLVTHVFDRPSGAIGQELGGVAVSLLALATAAGLSADEEECREVHRVLSKPVGEFTLRNAAKNAAGFKMVSSPEAL